MMEVEEYIAANPYRGYAYSYPHKTSYRPFENPLSLHEVWKNEDRESLFLYVHIPFCEMRCGFCNLFTMANPAQDRVTQYLHALERQAQITKSALGDSTFARIAVGGGTPSFLNEQELQQLFTILENTMGAKLHAVPASFEVSPKTVSAEKLSYLFDKGIDRISIGIQSFLEAEVKLLGRPQRNTEVYDALEKIKRQNFATLNIDLIYGGAGQTAESWDATLNTTLSFDPEEIYLYPLYVRPLTGLEKMGMTWDNFRLQLYRQGRDLLLDKGYEQVSMRMFRKKSAGDHAHYSNINYCCQEDGMVGLGAGARSYTETIHYSTEYAVARTGVVDIINHFTHSADEDFSHIHYGIRLTDEEKRRRYCIKSLLHNGGLDVQRYRELYDSDVLTDFPEIDGLIAAGMASRSDAGEIRLTPSGTELSDSIGPWMYSQEIQQLMEHYNLK